MGLCRRSLLTRTLLLSDMVVFLVNLSEAVHTWAKYVCETKIGNCYCYLESAKIQIDFRFPLLFNDHHEKITVVETQDMLQ